MLPEIASAVKGFLARREENARPVTLSLKGGPDININDPASYARNGYYNIASAMGGWRPTWSGETVNTETALNNPVVWACNRIISESVGFIPAVMLQQKGDAKEPAFTHPMYGALKNAPNDEITAQAFSEMLTSHCVLGGNSYAQIIRRSGTGTAIELQQLLPNQVLPDREKSGQKRLTYVIKEPGAADKTYTVQRGKPHDILHLRGLGWDGIRGYSVIQMGRQSIGTASAADRNVGRFWANGGRVPYNLKLSSKFANDTDAKKFREDWEATYSDPHKAPILEPWLEYQKTGLSMAEAQVLESRVFSIAEICRWFGVSPHLVGDLSRATFSNIEHLTLEFVKMTLTAWLTRWEQELWRCVLTNEEKAQGYFWKHNVNALLRGDFPTRMAGYASALQNGHMNVDEVRDLEDRNALPDGAGEAYHIQLNQQALPAAGEPLQSQPSLVRLGPK